IGGHVVARDDRVARGVRVVDVEEPVGHVVGMEREAEKTLLAAAGDERADVEEGRGPYLRAVIDPDATRLLHDKQAPRPVAGVGDADWRSEARGDRLEAEGELRRGTAVGPYARRHGDEKRHPRAWRHAPSRQGN